MFGEFYTFHFLITSKFSWEIKNIEWGQSDSILQEHFVFKKELLLSFIFIKLS